jgi:ABC-type sugar transport system permease subunit
MRRNLEGWLFASPWIVGFVLFTVGPMLASAVMAFMKCPEPREAAEERQVVR